MENSMKLAEAGLKIKAIKLNTIDPFFMGFRLSYAYLQ